MNTEKDYYAVLVMWNCRNLLLTTESEGPFANFDPDAVRSFGRGITRNLWVQTRNLADD